VTVPAFLDRATVEVIHADSIKAFGGSYELRDAHILESAPAQPMNTFYYAQGDLFDCAAAYAYHVAENQPFVDGNKRVALLSALNFLAVNDVELLAPTPLYYEAMIGVAEKWLDKMDLANLFREQDKQQSESELRLLRQELDET